MIRALRVVALTALVTVAVDLGIAYWWLSYGPFPENALNLID